MDGWIILRQAIEQRSAFVGRKLQRFAKDVHHAIVLVGIHGGCATKNTVQHRMKRSPLSSPPVPVTTSIHLARKSWKNLAISMQHGRMGFEDPHPGLHNAGRRMFAVSGSINTVESGSYRLSPVRSLFETLEPRRLFSGQSPASPGPEAALPPKQVESLNRGVVAVRSGSTSIYVSFRMLGTDS